MRVAYVPGVDCTWEVREIEKPRPGVGQVLVRVRASGICYSDVWSTIGRIPQGIPGVLGHETVGEIVEVGAGVTARQVGDRVGTSWTLDTCGPGTNCVAPAASGFSTQGGHAEFIAVPASATVLLPDNLSYEVAAPVICAGYTTWSALCDADPKPNERVAVLGIGGLGHMALQFAKASGYETVAITHSPDKVALATELGADMVVSDGAELKAAGGADVILMTGNSNRAAMDSMKGLRPDGRLVLIGLPFDQDFTIPPPGSGVDFVMNRNKLIGTTHRGAEHLTQALYLTQALDIVARGDVRPIYEAFPLDQVADAYAKVVKGEIRFRAVLTY